MELNGSIVDNVMEAIVSPQQRFLRCLMGAAKANKTELKMVVPSTRAFDKENPQADMVGAFGFSEDPDLCDTPKPLPTDHGGRRGPKKPSNGQDTSPLCQP